MPPPPLPFFPRASARCFQEVGAEGEEPRWTSSWGGGVRRDCAAIGLCRSLVWPPRGEAGGVASSIPRLRAPMPVPQYVQVSHPDKRRHVLSWIEGQRPDASCRHLMAPYASSSHKARGSKSRSTHATTRGRRPGAGWIHERKQRRGQGAHQRSAARPSVTRSNAPSKAKPLPEHRRRPQDMPNHGDLTGRMRGMPRPPQMLTCAPIPVRQSSSFRRAGESPGQDEADVRARATDSHHFTGPGTKAFRGSDARNLR